MLDTVKSLREITFDEPKFFNQIRLVLVNNGCKVLAITTRLQYKLIINSPSRIGSFLFSNQGL